MLYSKVQRPECENIIALDIYILRELSGTLSQVRLELTSLILLPIYYLIYLLISA
jgi:hypothetical protein